MCGSDLHAYQGLSDRRVPPLVMGHEFAGDVEETGRDAKNVEVGDKVVVNPLIVCGECDRCIGGSQNICVDRKLIGLSRQGALAEYVAVPSDRCLSLPDEMSYEEGSMVEPAAVAVHATSRASICSDDAVAIVGTGVIGLLTLQAVRLRGPSKIFVIDLLEERLGLAKRFGADEAINPREVNPVDRVMQLTNRAGVDCVLEAVGVQETVREAMEMASDQGRVVVIGMLQKSMELEALQITVRELSVMGAYAYADRDFEKALGLISEGRINVRPLITTVLPLYSIREGFEALANQRAIKVILKP
ncbi:MAG: alcohol dehydrogenase catalytic domain-containing protein [Aigarchaeota archaeon]|nr:alcohol dehydrogenase catalytic domain-containing protein [Aigarchaeota archaeon]